MSRVLQAKGYQVLLVMTETGDQDEIVQKMLQYQVDGIIMASATLSSTLAQECASTGTPVVLFNRTVPTLQTSSVTSDNIAGGRALAEFLTRAGHQRIAFIAGHEDSSTSQDREHGFRAGLTQPLFARAVGAYTTQGAITAARTLMDQPNRPDAIFVANDHMAFPVIDLLRREYQLRIPQDISIVGYDDVPEAAWDAYNLTTIAQPAEQMVNATVQILLEQIESQTITQRTEILPTRLIIRGSARTPIE
jgi:DNA-binding LacI/PurR family transcriptional regulator